MDFREEREVSECSDKVQVLRGKGTTRRQQQQPRQTAEEKEKNRSSETKFEHKKYVQVKMSKKYNRRAK